jgi:ABC-type bacteriocin/lantibiotic exporter with double-glycine peptidase domain
MKMHGGASPGRELDATAFGLGALRSGRGAGPLAPVERLRRLAALEHGDLLVVVIYAIAIGLVSLAVPVAAQSLVNTVAFTALVQPIVVLSVLVLIGLLAAGLLQTLQYRVIETLQQRFFVRATHESVRRLAQADVRAFAERGAPELMNRFFDVALVQKAASTLLIEGISAALQAVVSLVLLAFYHPALLAFDVVLLALLAFILFGLGRRGVATAIKESKAKYETAAWLEEMAGAFRTFKAPGGDALAFVRADALARAYLEARGKHFKVLLRQIVGSYVLQAVATAGLLGLGGFLVIRGQLTLGQLVAAELIVTSVLAAVSKLGKYLESYYDLVASVDKVGVIVDLESEREGGAARARREGPAGVRLEGIGFSYDGAADVLHDVSLVVAPGARVAVLGSDASGKSTLVDLLYGLRVPTRGRLEIDGVDVRTLALDDLRRDIALVGKPEVFDASVLDNLRLGREDVDAGLIAEVLEIVALADDVGGLPEGASTRLGHSGSRLTSSQASRLAIARSLVAQPRLLVIDETLDGLGAETARKVLRGIARARDATSVIVFTSSAEIAAEVGTVVRLDGGTIHRSEEVFS